MYCVTEEDSHTVPAFACDSKITTLASSLFTCKPKQAASKLLDFAALQTKTETKQEDAQIKVFKGYKKWPESR